MGIGKRIADVAKAEMEGAAGMDADGTIAWRPDLVDALSDDLGIKRVLKTRARGATISVVPCSAATLSMAML